MDSGVYSSSYQNPPQNTYPVLGGEGNGQTEGTSYPIMTDAYQQQYQQPDQQQQVPYQENLKVDVQRPDSSQRIVNPFILDEEKEIIISVGEPITKETTLSRHTVYNIKGQDKLGQFDVYRRFSEFYALKELLAARWPGCFIPSIPAKEINSTSQNVVENRARFLNSFCNQMSRLKHLFYSEEFQYFLRSKDSDVSKSLLTMKKVSISDIIDKYQSTFPEACQAPISSDLEIKINSWSGFLKKAITSLKNQKEQLKTLASMRKELNQQFSRLNHEILPEYEKCLITEYVSNDTNCLIFCNPANTSLPEFNQKFDNSTDKNSFQHIYDMVKFELRDAEAFEEAIREKESQEKRRASIKSDLKDDQDDLTKLISGKKTVKALFSSSDEQKRKLEQKIEQYNVDLKNMDNLIEIITKIIGLIEIDRFRSEKKQTYSRVLQCVADSETANSLDLMGYWSNVNDSATKLLKI